MVRKLNHFHTNRHRVIQKRCLKHFNQELFINDLGKVPWDSIQDENPNHQWEKWKALFTAVVDKHAPLKRARIRNKRSPWLTSDIASLIRKRDLLKIRAMDTNDANNWNEYRNARNTVNNEIKKNISQTITKRHELLTRKILVSFGIQ